MVWLGWSFFIFLYYLDLSKLVIAPWLYLSRFWSDFTKVCLLFYWVFLTKTFTVKVFTRPFYQFKDFLYVKSWYWTFFRNLRYLITLFLMDTSLHQNALLIETIRREVVSASLLEAFLESAPQFVLQCFIVLCTGIISKLLYCSA
jgi:hypothetical protein